MRVNWLVRNEEWAFKHLAKHIVEKMPEYKHSMDAPDGDIQILMTPLQLTEVENLHNCILHIDSNRWMV